MREKVIALLSPDDGKPWRDGNWRVSSTGV
jgi:hypothetical protein